MRQATITLMSGAVLREANVIGAGNGSDRGMDLLINHVGGRDWFNTYELASIVWVCGRPSLPEDADEWCGLPAGHDGGCEPYVRPSTTSTTLGTGDTLKW